MCLNGNVEVALFNHQHAGVRLEEGNCDHVVLLSATHWLGNEVENRMRTRPLLEEVRATVMRHEWEVVRECFTRTKRFDESSRLGRQLDESTTF
jgi:hypothetical protein